MAEPGAQMAAAAGDRGRMRASHADREQVIDLLKAAFVQGRLAKGEFETRVGQTFLSRTYAELAAITAGIPAGPATTRPPSQPGRPRARLSTNKAVTGTACVIVAAHVGMGVALLSGNAVLVLLTVALILVGAAAAVVALLVAS